jgi:hypothetical protein
VLETKDAFADGAGIFAGAALETGDCCDAARAIARLNNAAAAKVPNKIACGF